MHSMHSYAKISSCFHTPKSPSSLSQIHQQSFNNLKNKYSTSQIYFHTQLINKIVNYSYCKKDKGKNPEAIYMRDLEYDDEEEIMDKCFKSSQISQELPELLEYYKYYSQKPACYLKQQCAIMFEYQQRKKIHLYNKLKKVLELSESLKNMQSLEKMEETKNIPIINILKELNLTKKSEEVDDPFETRDQSYYFKEIIFHLNQIFGVSRFKTINKIDKNYKFLNHKITFQKPRITKNHTLKTVLQSTNVSTKNTQVKKTNKHRRYGSNEQYRTQKKYLRRNGSMQNLNKMKTQEKKERKWKKSKKKSKRAESGKHTVIRTDMQLKLSIEEAKRKINMEKMMVCQSIPKVSKSLKLRKKC